MSFLASHWFTLGKDDHTINDAIIMFIAYKKTITIMLSEGSLKDLL